MEIPLNTPVACSDGEGGKSVYVIVDPASEKVTHVVVQESGLGGELRLVPLDVVLESGPDRILIRLTREELHRSQPFYQKSFLPGTGSFMAYPQEGYLTWPAVAPVVPVPLETPQNPPGTIEFNRGSRIQASDGEIGKLDEVLIDPVSQKITHLILREGNFWNKKEVVIPVAEVARIADDAITLKLSKDQIEHLPDARP